LSFIAGSSASLRASGIVRYINATFLVVWLAGWALGEVVALGFLIMLIRSVVGSAAGLPWPIPGGDWIAGGAAGFVLLFLLVWLTLWTVGGLAAFNELLRSLAGEDHISVQPAGVELRQRPPGLPGRVASGWSDTGSSRRTGDSAPGTGSGRSRARDSKSRNRPTAITTIAMS
jgi:hypothetical protein